MLTKEEEGGEAGEWERGGGGGGGGEGKSKGEREEEGEETKGEVRRKKQT